MKKKLVVLVAAVALGISMVFPAVALAGGDKNQEQILNPVGGDYQNAGSDPLFWGPETDPLGPVH